jgi:hypothetical protein
MLTHTIASPSLLTNTMNSSTRKVSFGLEARACSVHFSMPDAADRAELEAFIRHQFYQAHGAQIKFFMPCLMSLRDSTGKLMAACGLRSATDEPLFLETYLDQSIEARLSAAMGYTIRRTEIVEVGNFAVATPGAARCLVHEIIKQLHLTAKQWAVFTIIPLISNAFAKMGVQAEALGEAKIDRIPAEERENWGRYYEQKPQIMAVRRF